jgi:DNA-directed RNA polymerase subunit RPC12/RpoP
MFFFVIIGTRFFSWGSGETTHAMRCGKCGYAGAFKTRSGMQFVTVFFIVPVIPISGVKSLVQCPNCGTRFQAG